MKKTKVLLTCFGIIVAVFLMGTAPAYSSGYPALGLYLPSTAGDTSVIVVAKFDSSFNVQDVDSFFAAAMSLIGGSMPQGLAVYGPSQLVPYQITDADILKNTALSIYQELGISLYIFLDVTKVNSVDPQYGQNVRINAWLADAAYDFGFTGNYLYAASVEVPEVYFQMLSQLLLYY